jgi:hypothetical protein
MVHRSSARSISRDPRFDTAVSKSLDSCLEDLRVYRSPSCTCVAKNGTADGCTLSHFEAIKDGVSVGEVARQSAAFRRISRCWQRAHVSEDLTRWPVTTGHAATLLPVPAQGQTSVSRQRHTARPRPCVDDPAGSVPIRRRGPETASAMLAGLLPLVIRAGSRGHEFLVAQSRVRRDTDE